MCFRLHMYVAVLTLLLASGMVEAQECPTVPSLPKAHAGYEPVYTGPNASVRDPERAKIASAINKQHHDAHRALLKMATEGYLNNDDTTRRCALSWLLTWAERDVHTSIEGCASKLACHQAIFELKWMLISKSQSYLLVRNLATAEQAKQIVAWTTRMAEEIHSKTKPGAQSHITNNHEYWVGAALMMAGAVTEDAKYVKIAHRYYRNGLRDIRADGFTNRELTRRDKARHYHAFTVAPMILMARMAQQFGEDWASENDGALGRLVTATVRALVDDTEIAAAARVPAMDPALQDGVDLAWLPIAREMYGRTAVPASLQAKNTYDPYYIGGAEALLQKGFFGQKYTLGKDTSSFFD